MQVEFNTRPFFRSHMREPRGFGSWAFEFEDSPDAWFAPTSTYADAKKAAKAEAHRRAPDGKYTVVQVLP
jgi:hypothetical protein